MFEVTQEAIDRRNAAAVKSVLPTPEIPGIPCADREMARFRRGPEGREAPTGPVTGVPAAADGIPAARHSPPAQPPPVPGEVHPGQFKRPYIAEGHGTQSPGNPPGLASQAAHVSQAAMTRAGRRP